MITRRTVLAVAVLLVSVIPRVCEGSDTPLEGWELTWKDEFDAPKLDDGKWSRCRRSGTDWANTMSPTPELLVLKDGVMRLRGVKNTDKDKGEEEPPFLTSGVTSKGKFSYQHGKVQIRARFKSAQGAWPALWMMGNEGRHPDNGEIDLMEHLNFDDIVYQTVHSPYTLQIDKTNTPKKGGSTKIDRDDWNTYGCEWNADKIIFTVNGKPSHSYPRVPDKGEAQWPFKQPFYFIMSMQIGGKWVNAKHRGPTNPEDYPAWMEIDWVRVYKKT